MSEKTEANLQQAFAGESQANRRYLFFADKADKESLPQVARLFRVAAEAETVHAYNHFNTMTGIGTSIDNLSAAVIGEHQEFTRMYPAMINQAIEEGNKRAQTSFEWADAVEKIHYDLFQEMLKAVKEKQSIKNEPYFVCPVCGNTVLGKAPDKCPVCGAPGSKFKKIE
ncbi:MAG: rubrerythrin family protein [Dehalococcoidales bacterium]|nr:rubrerythrin family protein [Dehalococcoidales bacterium]